MAAEEPWRAELERWLAPFLDALSPPASRRMCPAYVAGLIGPGDRKSVQPMATPADGIGYDRLHHFVAAGVWDAGLLEAALLVQADRLVGGANTFLVVDDTALPKKGRHSVGVAPQYASALGKNANCQTMVSLTLASGGVPVMVGLRLFLPESWTGDPERLARAHVPGEGRVYRTKPEIALVANLPADTSLKQLAAAVKARWVCEQAHQQLKEKLGLDHFEGRSWTGLHPTGAHDHERLCLPSITASGPSRARNKPGGEKRAHSLPP